MSLILEALRKSEAERRRGQAPQLFDVAAPVAALPSKPARVMWWWAAAGLIALALAVLWWRNASAPDTRPDAALGNSVAVVTTEPAGNASADIGLPGEAPPSNVQPSPTLATETPDIAPVTSPVQDGPSMPSAGTPARSAEATIGTTPAPSTSPPPAPTARVAEQASPPIASAPPMNPMPAPAPATTPAPASSSVMRLSDLTATERSALPPLRMSMHMWRPDPAGRFVILDGTRVGEGDLVGSAVLDEITPDGAVLNWQGRRLKVPVR